MGIPHVCSIKPGVTVWNGSEFLTEDFTPLVKQAKTPRGVSVKIKIAILLFCQFFLGLNALADQPNNECNENSRNLNKDQTETWVFQSLANTKDPDPTNKFMGCAIYLIPDPEKGALEYKKIVVKDITYNEAVKRGIDTSAFKWFPYSGKDKIPWDPWPKPPAPPHPIPHPDDPIPGGPGFPHDPVSPGPAPDPFPPTPQLCNGLCGAAGYFCNGYGCQCIPNSNLCR